MVVTLGRGEMAKKQGRPKKPSGEGMQVRIDAQIGRRAKVVASESGMSLADYLSGILRDRVEKDYRKVVKDIDEGSVE
jgi:predicted HicB family RNase H-like nuclease